MKDIDIAQVNNWEICVYCGMMVSDAHVCPFTKGPKYTCVDCGAEGALNSEISYRGNDHICWKCLYKWRQGGIHLRLFDRYGKRSNKNT